MLQKHLLKAPANAEKNGEWHRRNLACMLSSLYTSGCIRIDLSETFQEKEP